MDGTSNYKVWLTNKVKKNQTRSKFNLKNDYKLKGRKQLTTVMFNKKIIKMTRTLEIFNEYSHILRIYALVWFGALI